MQHTTAYRPLAVGAVIAAAVTLLSACSESPVAPAAERAAATPPEARTSLELVALPPGCPAGCQIQTVVATKRVSSFESAVVLMTTGGGELKQLTSGAIDRYPAFSPDRSKIAFLSTRSGGGLFVMNADGTAMMKVAPAPGNARGLSWSPDGSKIAFSASPAGTGELYVVGASGAGLLQLTNDSYDDYGPAYAPNGSLTFTSDRLTGGASREYDLWRMTPGSGIFQRLTWTTNIDELDPTVSSDGTRLAFVLKGRTSDWWETRVGDANAGGQSSMWATLGPNHPLSAPTFSPDGKYLMFVRTDFGEAHLLRVNVATGVGDQISANGVHYSTPGWFN
jgi:Tol biopolymer transport system component